jgi:hypothetical protein
MMIVSSFDCDLRSTVNQLARASSGAMPSIVRRRV